MRIRLAFFSPSHLPNDPADVISALPFGDAERSRLLAIKHGKAQRESLSALLALRSLCDLDDLTMLRDEHGKPRFSSIGAPYFSLSHTDGLSVAAISYDAPVGVDLESARDKMDTRAVADRFFTEAELREFSAHGDFLALWTKKEARAKCLGAPLSSVLTTDLALFARTYRFGDFTLSLAAEREFSVAFPPNVFPFQEVNL